MFYVPRYELVLRGAVRTLDAVGQVVSSVASPSTEKELGEVCLTLAAELPVECGGVVMYNARGRAIGLAVTTRGDTSGVYVSSESVLIHTSLLAGCTSVTVWHNHLSGSAEPSVEDVALFERLLSELSPVVHLRDFAIFAPPAGVYSFRQRGHFKSARRVIRAPMATPR